MVQVARALKLEERAMEKEMAGRWVTTVEMWEQAEELVKAAERARSVTWAVSTGRGRPRDAFLAALEASQQAVAMVSLADRYEDQSLDPCPCPGKARRA